MTGKKLYKDWGNFIFFLSKMCQILSKNLMWVSGKPQILHRSKLCCAEKKHVEIIFLPEAHNIVKLGSEILKYLPTFSSYKYIWCAYLRLVFYSSPQFYSHPACRMLELQLILWKFLLMLWTVVNSYPNINQKWIWAAGDLQIFLSEIIGLQENGGCGKNLDRNSNFHFY